MYKTYPFFYCLILEQKSASYTRDGTVIDTEHPCENIPTNILSFFKSTSYEDASASRKQEHRAV